jgi:hypothetical protein
MLVIFQCSFVKYCYLDLSGSIWIYLATKKMWGLCNCPSFSEGLPCWPKQVGPKLALRSTYGAFLKYGYPKMDGYNG